MTQSIWWKRMIEKHGSKEAVREHMSSIGAKGGGTKPSAPRGFACMTKEQHKSASAKGGRVKRKRY